jgi:hypothetical protein
LNQTIDKSQQRTSRAGRIFLLVVAFVALLLGLGVVAPWIDASRFSGPIQQAVETSLGRKIQFGKIRLSLFSGPAFTLEDVSIAEDPRYGAEPFAWVPTLHAHLRIDKLLRGQVQLSSVKLDDPALNLVKRSDGTWNVVELVQRLSAPRRMPLSFFPTFEVSDGRIDFKLGARKSTFYILDADLSVYPERSGTFSVRFSGSPARTDRAGNGFGHLHGSARWSANENASHAQQLDADLTLDPSNLSELTTLFAGEDIGVHGSISGHARASGPLTGLQLSGDLRLGDVHRWDLLPASGAFWRVQYAGGIDWSAHRLNLHTLPAHEGEPTPVALQLNVNNLLKQDDWSLLAQLDKAPVDKLLLLGRRMGLSLPDDLKVAGAALGNITYASAQGLSGSVTISNASATLPDVPPLHTDAVNATVFPDRIHFDPAIIDTTQGSLRASGDYYLSGQRSLANLEATGFSIDALKSAIGAWFGTPPVFSFLNGGRIQGGFTYVHQQPSEASWSGQFQFADAALQPEGLAQPLTDAGGQVAFDATDLELTRFTAKLGRRELRAGYRYSANARRSERVRLELAAADLSDLEKALEPALNPQDLLARLHVTHRTIPAWLAARNLEGDIIISAFSIAGTPLGPMTSHFIWQGPNLQLSPVQVNLPEGILRGRGSIDLASYNPRSRFTAEVLRFPWRGGTVSAAGTFVTSGTGADSLKNLRASGTFQGNHLNFSSDDEFSKMSGQFDFSFADGWPNLRISRMQASDGLDAWNGTASSQSDGKLVIELERAGHQRHVVSSLTPPANTSVSLLEKLAADH